MVFCDFSKTQGDVFKAIHIVAYLRTSFCGQMSPFATLKFMHNFLCVCVGKWCWGSNPGS